MARANKQRWLEAEAFRIQERVRAQTVPADLAGRSPTASAR